MILVTGATGQIGSKITEGLIQSKADVWVFVRDENRLGDLKYENIQVAEGTFEDMESLEKALEGVDRLMLIGQDNPDQVQQHLMSSKLLSVKVLNISLNYLLLVLIKIHQLL